MKPAASIFGFCLLSILSQNTAHATPVYLYTINFNPTPISAFTSVSYVSTSLLDGANSQFLPAQSTVLGRLGVGATLFPTVGGGRINNSGASLAFNLGVTPTWIFQGTTAAVINAPGQYAFASTQLSSRIDVNTVYEPTGEIVVQYLANSLSIFRYTETWNACGNVSGASFYYDSPVFLNSFQALTGADIVPITLPAAGFIGSRNAQLYGAGNGVGEAYFTNGGSDYYFYTAGFTPPFTTPGTFAFTTATSNFSGTQRSSTGSTSVVEITAIPEPATVLLSGFGALLFGTWRAAGKTRHVLLPRVEVQNDPQRTGSPERQEV